MDENFYRFKQQGLLYAPSPYPSILLSTLIHIASSWSSKCSKIFHSCRISSDFSLLYTSNYVVRLKMLNLQSLEYRRIHLDVAHRYRTVKQSFNIPSDTAITVASYREWRTHSLEMLCKKFKLYFTAFISFVITSSSTSSHQL